MRLAIPFFLFLTASALNGQVIYDADFSNVGDGFPDHTTGAPPAPAPATATGGTAPNAWTLSYDEAPDSDGSANIFSVETAGALRSEDWGGPATFVSQDIDVTGVTSVDIEAIGTSLLSGTQVAGGEFFDYYYAIDGGPLQRTAVVVGANEPVNYLVTDLDVQSATTLTVGFLFDENGGGDGYEISSFTVTGSGPVPVRLVSFAAVPVASAAQLSWTTAAERDNAYFSVEVSRDGADFAEATQVPGAGTTRTRSDYDYTYRSTDGGRHYFRLAQYDFDGGVTYSSVVTADIGASVRSIDALAYASDQLAFSLARDAEVRIVDLRGAVVARASYAAGRRNLSVADLAAGLYILTDGDTSLRFVRP